MKVGVVLGEICLLIFFLYKAFNVSNSAATVFFGLAGLMAILIIGSFFGFNNKK